MYGRAAPPVEQQVRDAHGMWEPRWAEASSLNSSAMRTTQASFAAGPLASRTLSPPRGISPRARSPAVSDVGLKREIDAAVKALRSVMTPDQFAMCKVSPSRLQRPKLLFLLRIVTAVSDTTGFARGLFDDAVGAEAVNVIVNPSAYDKERVRRGKIEYFDRLQQRICEALGEAQHPAATRAIITGGEAARTNVMLQKLCQAATISRGMPAASSVQATGAYAHQPSSMYSQQELQLEHQHRQQLQMEQQRFHMEQEQRRIAEQQRHIEQQRQETERQHEGEQQRLHMEQEQRRISEQQRLYQEQSTPPPAAIPAPVPEAVPQRPTVNRNAHSKLSHAMHKLHGVAAVTDLLVEVQKHVAVLSDSAHAEHHDGAYDALMKHITAKPAAHDDDRTAKHLAAETLHVQAKRFPHKREALIDALLHLDDELTAHEQSQPASPQGQPDLQKWLADAPPSLRKTSAFKELAQQAGLAHT